MFFFFLSFLHCTSIILLSRVSLSRTEPPPAPRSRRRVNFFVHHAVTIHLVSLVKMRVGRATGSGWEVLPKEPASCSRVTDKAYPAYVPCVYTVEETNKSIIDMIQPLLAYCL